MTVKDTEKIDKVALEMKASFDKLNEKPITAKSWKTIVMSSWEENTKEVSEKICNGIKNDRNGHYAETLKTLGYNINDLLAEQHAFKKFNTILIIESDSPGIVSECTQAMLNPEFREKVILLVPEEKHRDIIGDLKRHYVYFPRIFPYKDEEDLVISATKFAIREAWRNALTS